MPTDDSPNLFQYGSTWLRADFHLHTKADKEFKYTGEENQFLNAYVNKLKETDIRIGLITNHNKFDKDEFVNLKKNARKEGIFLLPGVELSVNDGANGVHTLIAFSDLWLEKGQDYINQFLNVAFQGKTPEQYEQENGRTSLSLLETLKKLNEYNRDYFLIFAHVEQDSGLWKELDGGRIQDLGKDALFQEKTLAFQKVRTHEVSDKPCRTKVQKWLENWYPAEVEGSDPKFIDHIGAKKEKTYLKIGDYTFEAVKYALRDYNNRVRHEKPEGYKHSHIKSISFEGGILDQQSIHLSPELNTLIGIRGSGKSSILEAIRYALGIPFGEKATDQDYKNDLVAHAFGSGGKALISAVDKHGQIFTIKRILNESSEVYVRGKLQPGVSIRETIIKKPIYFGQKDLSSSGEGFEKDLVEKLIGNALYEIRSKIEEKKAQVAESITALQKLDNLDEQLEDYTQKKQDAEFQLEKFTKYGIEEKFKKQTDFDADERKLRQVLTDADSFRSGLEGLIAEHEDQLNSHLSYVSEQNQDFFKQIISEYKKAVKILAGFKKEEDTLGEIIKNIKNLSAEFSSLKKKFTDEFAETRRKIEEELKKKGTVSLKLEEYPGLKSKIDVSAKMLAALMKQKSQKDASKRKLLQSLDELNELWLQEFNQIKSLLSKINDAETSLKIEVEFKGDKKEFLYFFKGTFRGSGIRETKFEQIIKSRSDFRELYKDIENVLIESGSQEAFDRYFMENLQTLLTYQVPNRFVIKYKGKELQQHSLGQRASALILFVLNQHDNDLILIDQPEDDLDNQTIYEDVIVLIRKLKPETQFIFATHNANFPVLGDAEQILSSHFSDEKVQVKAGSIDSPSLQREIVDIMEGGEAAFNKRKEIYGIWKSRN